MGKRIPEKGGCGFGGAGAQEDIVSSYEETSVSSLPLLFWERLTKRRVFGTIDIYDLMCHWGEAEIR